jgi:hypothetical protein
MRTPIAFVSKVKKKMDKADGSEVDKADGSEADKSEWIKLEFFMDSVKPSSKYS